MRLPMMPPGCSNPNPLPVPIWGGGSPIPHPIASLDSGLPRTQARHRALLRDPVLIIRPLRSHQRQLASLVAAIAAGETDARDILVAAALIIAGIVERICWVVPRDSLRLQAEEAFADPVWRATLGHALSVRAAGLPGDIYEECFRVN